MIFSVNKKTITTTSLFLLSSISVALPENQTHAFLQSFVQSYEFNISGRYVHEYHPYILKKTTNSIKELEEAIGNSTGDAGRRIVIMGY
jgi:hypothetical protein